MEAYFTFHGIIIYNLEGSYPIVLVLTPLNSNSESPSYSCRYHILL